LAEIPLAPPGLKIPFAAKRIVSMSTRLVVDEL